jgi:hypothetical protein
MDRRTLLNSSQLTRRQMLRAGSAVLALPWLESFARADEKTPPKRLVSICTGFGLYGPAFFPAADQVGRDYKPSEYIEVLGDLRKHCTVFSGISHPDIGGDHASESCFLTAAKHPRRPGFRNSVSMDYLAARHVGTATRFPLLTLKTDDGGTSLTFTESGASVSADYSPSALYTKLFLSGNPKEVAAETERLKSGQSVLDRMAGRFAEIEKGLSQRDRQQLSDYTEAVREMEKQLHANQEWIQRPKPTVKDTKPDDIASKADILGRAGLMLRMVRLALQTDSTRVCSLFIRGMDLKPPIEGVKENHHGLSHHGNNKTKIDELKVIEKAEMGVFRDFLAALRDTPDGAGTLLDQTQVLIGSNLGDASGHGTSNLPIILAGGGWKHGQHIAGDRRPQANTPLCNVYVSMMQRFGMKVDKFGSSTGAMNQLG